MIGQLLKSANESLIKCMRDQELKDNIEKLMKEEKKINEKVFDNMKELLKMQVEMFTVNNLVTFKKLKLIKEWRLSSIEKYNSVLMENDDYIDYAMSMNKIEFMLLHNKMKEDGEKQEECIENNVYLGTATTSTKKHKH